MRLDNAALAAMATLAALVASPAAAGEIKGIVKYAGAPPKLVPLVATKDASTCGKELPDQSLLVSNGRLENVVVTLKGGSAKVEPGKVTVDQQHCHYVPHVQAAAVGSSVDILNSDPILHNIHGYLGNATVFNLAMPLKNQKIPRKLDKPGLVRLKCDVHAWMSGYIVVTDSPYAVSGKDGAFEIKNVPPGSYTVTAWHEKLGEKTSQVTVPASGAATADFAFGG
jgi:plastocyanin